MVTRKFGYLVGLGLLAWSFTLHAQVVERPNPATPSAIASIDPRFGAIAHVLRDEGPASAFFGPLGWPGRTDGARALLRFAAAPSQGQLERVGRSGAQLDRGAYGPVCVGPVCGAFVPFDALDALAAVPGLIRIEAVWHPVWLQPLEVTTEAIGAAAAASLSRPGADGAGAVIGVIDSGVDVLHPHLFHADGGAFSWIDVDGDEVLRAGTDAVDLDGDGRAGLNETLRLLDGTWFTPQNQPTNADGVYQPGLDWLYADSNSDGERNRGRAAGFNERDPGYGEPLFVLDDADGDGFADPDERLLMLATSKVRRFVTSSRTYLRGTNLIDAEDVAFAAQSFHGTGVSSILVGGQPRAHGRVGVAPGADTVMYALHMDAPEGGELEAGQLEALQDAAQGSVGVLLHEWTNPFTAPHDGSGAFEAAMDAARGAGLGQVTPVGNLNTSQKHIQRFVAAGNSEELRFGVGQGFDVGGTLQPYGTAFVALFWRGAQVPALTLVNPSGVELALDLGSGSQPAVGSDRVFAAYEVTSRGTAQLFLTIWRADGGSIEQGTWALRIDATTVDDTFVGRVGDAYSGWGLGIRWDGPTRDTGTVTFPATADSAFGVTAYGGRHDLAWDGSQVGELRAFSGRGPRLDGAQVVDLAAPDDPYVAQVGSREWVDAGYGTSWFAIFGGTSGAGPHVAGAWALLEAQGVAPDDIERRLIESALVDAEVVGSLPSASWGYGKLDVFAAVDGARLVPVNDPPSAALDVIVDQTVTFDASATTDPEGDTLSFRIDAEYDGFWDTDWQIEPVMVVEGMFADGDYVARLEVRDSNGRRAGLVRHWSVAPPETMDEPAADAASSEDGGPPDAGEPGSSPRGCPACVTSPGPPSSPLWLLLVAGLGVLRARRY